MAVDGRAPVRTKILSERTADNVALWHAPPMPQTGEAEPGGAAPAKPAGEGAPRPEALQPVTAGQLEALQEAARQEGFRQGREEGLAAAAQELAGKAQEWAALLDALARPLAAVERRVLDELFALAAAVSRQIVRRELQLAPDEIVGVIREALAALPSQAADIRVELHPQDAELVREVLHDGTGERAWRIVEDPALSRGGCRVRSDASRVDATVEHRLNQAIAALLGDMRGGDDA